jgi:tetratricopeptide (TPR) repeat protein
MSVSFVPKTELLTCTLVTLALLTGISPVMASSTSLGSTNAGKCYQASLFPYSNHGLRSCNEAISRDQLTKRDLAATYSNRGIIHMRNGNAKKALRDHDRAVQLQPHVPRLHTNRGNALYYTHDYEDAITEFDKAINSVEKKASKSTQRITLYNKALTLLRMKRVTEAKTVLELALEVDPESKRVKDKLEDIASLQQDP